ncbi:adenosine 3'-phospho 5'-phosphosulfate transporter 1 [Hydra vulgaris]|uniref:adenosine 3'-phospho 5'-phosphosulfate transporter 1 n=1 Tax=Hydra vulgaris TaxID=6087 RepID=UPI0032EA011B
MFTGENLDHAFTKMFWCLFLFLFFASAMDNTDDSKKDGYKHHLPHRVHVVQQEVWFQSFGWNLLGYALIIIPCIFFIKMVQSSNFYERDGEGFIYGMIKCFVFGFNGDDMHRKTLHVKCFGDNPTLKLLICVLGLQGSYLTWGVLQEEVMTQKYGEPPNDVRFQNSEFLVFMNRVLALVISAVYIFVTGPNWKAPFYKFLYSSLSNICSSWCQYEALKFVSFPTQVLGKTCKLIPVMIMGKFILKKTYHYYEYVVAAMISIGMTLFLLSAATDKHYSAETTISGLIIITGYIVFDSFTSNWQSQLFIEYGVSSMQMMFNLNVFSAILSAVPLLISGGMAYSISFISQYSSFGIHVLIISLSSAVGQLFLFYTIAEFGPVVFTIIMVTRQMFSILLSCFLYGHQLTTQAVVGVIFVFLALFLQIYAAHRIKQKKNAIPEKAKEVILA